MWIFYLWCGAILFLVLYIDVTNQQKKETDRLVKNKNDIDKKLKEEKYNISKNIPIINSFSGNVIMDIKLDIEQKKLLICDYLNPNIENIEFNEIVECEILEDKNNVMKGGVGRAITGGILAGEVGAIVGANTRKSRNTIQHLQIRIITKNVIKPLYKIDLIDSKEEIETNTTSYKEAFGIAEEIYSTVISIINDK